MHAYSEREGYNAILNLYDVFVSTIILSISNNYNFKTVLILSGHRGKREMPSKLAWKVYPVVHNKPRTTTKSLIETHDRKSRGKGWSLQVTEHHVLQRAWWQKYNIMRMLLFQWPWKPSQGSQYHYKWNMSSKCLKKRKKFWVEIKTGLQ